LEYFYIHITIKINDGVHGEVVVGGEVEGEVERQRRNDKRGKIKKGEMRMVNEDRECSRQF